MRQARNALLLLIFLLVLSPGKGADTDLRLASSRDLIQAGPPQLTDSVAYFREMAFFHAENGDADAATKMVLRLFEQSFRPELLSHMEFDAIRSTPQFEELLETYTPQRSLWSYLYLYIGLIGLYIGLMLMLHRRIDLITRMLIGCFVAIHSVFILHICLVISNYQFQYPHSYLISTGFSFLYGPLLYFYFKRSTRAYSFKYTDLLHLLPTVLLLGYLVPIYVLPETEKLSMMLNRSLQGLNPSDSAYLMVLVGLKFTSLAFYGWLIRREFLRKDKYKDLKWKRNVYGIHIAYVICYGVYGFLIINDTTSGLLYHAQVVSMSMMVLYVGYFANLKPQVFSEGFPLDARLFRKYRKSGLTPSLSLELRDHMVRLFEQEKIFRENDLNLDGLSELLNTNRHNTSQVINEHFQISFHELVNKYRISEAKRMLENDIQRNLNIIDIAYEVGYNNKVTFNKAFKKETQLTPSQYQQRVVQLRVKRA